MPHVERAAMTYDHIRAEGKAGRMGARLMAIVAEGDRERVYLGPTLEHEAVVSKACPSWKPETRYCPTIHEILRRRSTE